MKILLRKIAGEGVALLCSARAAGGSCAASPPSLLSIAAAFAVIVFVPLALLALTALALLSGDASVLMAGLPAVALRENRQKRMKAVEAARAINDAANGREMTAEERAQYDAHMAESRRLKEVIDREEQLAEEEREMAGQLERDRKPEPGERRTPENESAEQRTARIVREVRAMDDATYSAIPEVREFGEALRYQAMSAQERRALEVGNSASGGYLQPPQEFVARLIQAVDNMTFIRRLATKFSIPQAESLGAPSLDNDPADPTWVGELNIGSEDSTMSFGKRELRPHPLAQFIKASRTLLRKAAIGPEALIRERLAYKTAVVQENAFLNGNGAAQPLGVFTANAAGISTSRDVSTGNTSSSMTFDGLKAAKWSVKSQYWPRLQWIFHPDGGEQIDKLKDGNGQYIWQPSVVVGQPDRLLSFPVNFSEYAPSTFTSGLYVGILGDFSNYWIADALSMEIQQLNELYAATNQVGFITRSETDGMPVLEEAFARVKLG